MGPCSSHGCSKQWNVHQILKTQTIVITFCCVWERTSHILVCKMTQIMALLISWSESQNETKPIGQTKANIEKKCEVWNKMSLVILRKVDVCNLQGEVPLTSNIFLGWGVSPLLPIMFYHILPYFLGIFTLCPHWWNTWGYPELMIQTTLQFKIPFKVVFQISLQPRDIPGLLFVKRCNLSKGSHHPS